MASWSEVESEAPELAALARRIFDFHVHKTPATLRRDGSPRISGTEIRFADAGRSHLFRADITELVVTRVGGDPPDHLVIESWHPGRGVERRERH